MSQKSENYLEDFSQFLQQYNIVGMGIGTLVAVSAYNMGREFTEAVVMPVVNAITTQGYDLAGDMRMKGEGLVKAIINFLVTMFIIFFMIKLFNIKMTRWVQYVKVVNNDPEYKGW